MASTTPVPTPIVRPSYTFDNWDQLCADLDHRIPENHGVMARPFIGPEDVRQNITAPVFLQILRAHQEGRSAYYENMGHEPIYREDASPSEKIVMLLFFQQGFTYAETLSAAAGTPQSTPSRRVAKVNDPEHYKGEQDKYDIFETQLELKFNSDPAAFVTEASKVTYAASFLKGPAYLWYMAQRKNTTDFANNTTYNDFMASLKNAWADPDAVSTAERKLRVLKQGNNPISVYYSKFVEYMSVLQWDETAQISQFRQGLCEEVKDLMVHREKPKTMAGWYQTTLELDNAWRSRLAEKRASGQQQQQQHRPAFQPRHQNFHNGNKPQNHQSRFNQPRFSPQPRPQFTNPTPPRPAPAPTPSTGSGTHPGPMDLSNTRFKKLTPAQRAYRRANNLCSYCGDAGHYAATCNKKTPPRAYGASTNQNQQQEFAPRPQAGQQQNRPNGEVIFSANMSKN